MFWHTAGLTEQSDQRMPGRDRRRKPTRPWDVLVTPARRRTLRRSRDSIETRFPFVDRHGPHDRAFSIALLLLTLLDGVLTILLLQQHCEEANPFLAWVLESGVGPFFAVKYGLTATGLAFFLMFREYRIFGTSLRVGHLIPCMVALYLALLIHQFVLLNQA